MDLLKELYAFESYFLTKKGLELGDKRWLEKHLVNFMESSPVIFKNVTNLFRRVLRLMLKDHPSTKVSIYNNKREFVVRVDHPMLNLLPGAAAIPYRVFELETVIRPPLPHLRTHPRFRYPFHFPGVGTSSCLNPLANKFSIGTNPIQFSSGSYLLSRRHYCSAAEARHSAKIFVGNNSFMSFADEIKSYIAYLEDLCAAVYDILGADIEDIIHINNIQAPMIMVIQPGADIDLDTYLDACVTE